MEKGTINLKLPLIKVSAEDHWRSVDFVKENYPKGCFIIDDGTYYYLVSHDGSGYICDMLIERGFVIDAIVEDARFDEFKKSFDIIEEIENRLQQIARVCGETKDEVIKSEVRLTETIAEQSARQITEFNTIREGMEILEKGENIIMEFIQESKGSGNGVNILDVAKSFAVIQKPELIEKL